MLRFITVDKNFYENGMVFLTCGQSVETEFVHVLNWNKDAYRDKESLKLIKDIDSAERIGDYGVVTPYGESCITCLSTGCKFALLILFYKRIKKAKIVTDIAVAGINVWNWLAENVNYEVYIYKENVDVEIMEINNAEVLHEEKIYGQGDKIEYLDMIFECEDYPYKMIPELEKKAYENHCRLRSKKVYCFPKEEIDFNTFVRRFSEGEQYLEYDKKNGFYFGDYKVINYCSTILNDFSYRRLPLYVCGVEKNQVKYQKICSIKWPNFLGIMISDILEGDWWDESNGKQTAYKYSELFTSWFVLVLKGEERCKVEEYPQETLFGIGVETEKKTVTIYDSEQAVEHFHALYTQCELCQYQ